MSQAQAAQVDHSGHLFADKVKAGRKALLWSGLAMVLVGLLSIIFPLLSTLSITFFVAGLLIASGIALAIGAFAVTGTGPFFGHLLLGLLNVAAGLFIFKNPLLGMVYLTAMAGVIFLIQGAHEMSFAFSLRPRKGWGWQLFSSLISIAAGVVLLIALPETSLWFVGFVFGFNFLSTGLASVLIANKIHTN